MHLLCSAGHFFFVQHLISLSPFIAITFHSCTGLVLYVLCSSLSIFLPYDVLFCKLLMSSSLLQKLFLREVVIEENSHEQSWLSVCTNCSYKAAKKSACSSTSFFNSLTLIGVFIENHSLTCFRVTTPFYTGTYHLSHLLKQYMALLLSLSVHFFIHLDDFFRHYEMHKLPLCIFINWPSVHTCFKSLSFLTYVFLFPSLSTQTYKNILSKPQYVCRTLCVWLVMSETKVVFWRMTKHCFTSCV